MGTKVKIKRNVESDKVIMSEVFRQFIEEKVISGLAQPTISSYEKTYKKFIEFCEFDDETTTDAISRQTIFHWIGTMQLDGLTHSSINHYLRDIRAFLYWCMDDARKYIEPSFKIECVKGQEEKPKDFESEEIEILLEKPKARESFATWRTWAIVNFILATGARSSTVCNIKLEDISYKNKEIILGHTKNKKAQIVPLSSALETVLKEYCRVWRSGIKEGYLFCNIGEEKLTTNALRIAFRKYTEDRGIDKTNLHGLRHSFARDWVKNNGNMFALQRILGHETMEMTRRYVKIYGEDLKEDFDKFNPLDSMKRKSKRTQTVKRSF
jgi:integrase/recombinase XerD